VATSAGSGGPASDQQDDSLQPYECDGGAQSATTVITCLPSPGCVQLDPSSAFEQAGGQLSQSPSFCLDAAAGSGQRDNGANLLTASDVFKRSKNFIKRPSTMMASDEAEDAMNQVAAALGQASVRQQQQQQQQQHATGLTSEGSIRRNRRQAIVPPKLATDAACAGSDGGEQPQVGRLVDLVDDAAAGLEGAGARQPPPSVGSRERRHRYGKESVSMDEFCAEEEAQLSTIRRKRSGGGIEKLSMPAGQHQTAAKPPAAAADGQQHRPPLNLPTFQIEDPLSVGQANNNNSQLLAGHPAERPDSQATNADSIVSSESTVSMGISDRLSPFGGANSSSGALSPNGTCGAGGGGSSAGSLAVPFSSSSRRRSSIAVIPQMQICPGDLLVYSKQLIDRMNQTDENEPPQFLTIDDKKGKNIWSSFKLVSSRLRSRRRRHASFLLEPIA
jgi:hypothetical protein